jgi:hypothetical protein
MYFQSSLPMYLGVWLLVWFMLLCHLTVRSSRDSPLCLGVLDCLERRHWLPGDYFKAHVRLRDETEITVVVARRLVAKLLGERGQAEVLILYQPKQAYSIVIGARASAEPEMEGGIRSARDIPPPGSFRSR